ncbi:MAG: SDR family oxidoreductase [Chitinophagaceae bacterium]|nr:MAG: SDR family oxidoreductase [Chitinophagaceae bacterium]
MKKTTQIRPGRENKMQPRPQTQPEELHKKLDGKVALITGGDSGIGKAVAILFAQHGADVAISYLNEHEDAEDTKTRVEAFGKTCLLLPGDLGKEAQCKKIVSLTLKKFKRLDVLVNNAAIHYPSKKLEDISTKNFLHSFQVNFFSCFFVTRAALPYLKRGAAIINTASVVAFRGSPELIDYAATKGAIVSFTRSLAINLAAKGIRVNGVAPGPIWTPLIPSSFKNKGLKKHGADTPLGRTGQPNEVAPSYLFLASKDSSYINGQFIHPNGGEIINT